MTAKKNDFKQPLIAKKWLYGSLVAVALVLGACADEGSATTEDDPTLDAQTEVEQQATDVASANETDNEMGSTRGEMSSLDGSASDDDVAVATDEDADTLTNEDIGVAGSTATGVDDADIIDGSESEEHVSTY